MNLEKVLSMCVERSIDIKDMPGGGVPDFTTEDARHSLAHMKPEAFNYCQYVFLLHGQDSRTKIKALKALTENTILHVVKHHPEIAYKKDGQIFINLCKMACIEQTKPAGKISHKSRYEKLGVSRHEWRYQWELIFIHASSYLNELDSEVKRHIYEAT